MMEGTFTYMVVPRFVASETLGFDSSSIFFTNGSKGGARLPVLVYIILVVPTPAFALGSQVDCLHRRCRAIFVSLDSDKSSLS
jgi:hypothetical protein